MIEFSMNRFQQNIARHYQRLAASAAVDVVYSRGEMSVAIKAVSGQTAVRVEDSDGVSVRSKRFDWIVAAADLVLGGIFVTPAVGDNISVSGGGRTSIYEVQRIAGEDCYYECDDLGTYLRIHTRLIGSENE